MSDKSNNQVLVLGDGMMGAEVANSISQAGYPVAIATDKKDIGKSHNIDLAAQIYESGSDVFVRSVEKLKDNQNVEILTESKITQVSGFVGDFQVVFQQGAQSIRKSFAAIIINSELKTQDRKKAYGLNENEKIMSISELEERLSCDSRVIKGKTIALLHGLKKESNPQEFGRLLTVASKLREMGNQVYVFADNLKLTSFNLDQKYHKIRSMGVVFLKSPGTSEFIINGEQLRIQYLDSSLLRTLELNPDYIVVDQDYFPNPQNVAISEILGVNLSKNNFLQAENVHNLVVRSNRKGVFVVGAGKQLQSAADSLSDVDNVVHELDRLFKLPQLKENELFAEVDTEKCVICLTCYRSCQHQAVTWVDGVAKVYEQACFACGICASECPMNAIQVKSYGDQSLMNQVIKAAKKPNNLLAFCCKNSATEAHRAAEKLKLSITPGLEVIELPCAGKLDMELIMDTLANGADGVLALGCHPGNCKSEKGSAFAKQRVAEMTRMMEAIGIEKERLRFGTLASNMGSIFHRQITQMEEVIKKLGPSPLK